MRLFQCQNCQHVVYFENTSCENCHHALGYLPALSAISAVTPAGAEWVALAESNARYRFCANWELHACNWLVSTAENEPYCAACRYNRTVPNLSEPGNLLKWIKIEGAKRRLIYSLIRLQLPLPTLQSGEPEPLIFDFLADNSATQGGPKVTTGHDNGVITLSLDEADDGVREALRSTMGEPYRTLLGHFRHEVGHYYWDKLVRDGDQLDGFRSLFGDESQDYEESLKRHYEQGAPADWQNSFVSSYATMHPWEDWAETWAHYLHIVDTLEMAGACGLTTHPEVSDTPVLRAEVTFDPYAETEAQILINSWLPVSAAINNLNRCMGQPDLYPFIIAPPVIQKLDYVAKLVHR